MSNQKNYYQIGRFKFMKQNFLLKKAYTYENVPYEFTPKECSYDRERGLWRVDSTSEVMMLSNFVQKSDTKKSDIEIGKDQKGE